MNEALQRRLIILSICVGLPVIFFMLPPTRPMMLATTAVFCHAMLWLFDCAFGAEAFGIPPLFTWALVGGVIGACLGFWSIAPAVGKRRMRRVAGAIPLTLVACLLLGDLMYSLSSAPKPPSLRPKQFGPDPNVAPAPTNTALTNPPQGISQTGQAATDPNNEKPPSLYSMPKDEELSTAPEGGGGPAADQSVDFQGTARPGQKPPTSTNPLNNLRLGGRH